MQAKMTPLHVLKVHSYVICLTEDEWMMTMMG